MADSSLETLLARFHAPEVAANPQSIASSLASFVKREDGLQVLRGSLQNNVDPLEQLVPAEFTLPYLYILTARLTGPAAQTTNPQFIHNFCSTFDSVHARLAPEQITILARRILALAEETQSLQAALDLLSPLLSRYPPSPSFLTTIHPTYLAAAVQARQFPLALSLIELPITNFDKSLSDLDHTDVLQYYYLGGVIYAVLRLWEKAEEFLETVVSAPAQTPSAIQLEAFKKLTLVQLIRHGKTLSLPKYTNASLVKQMKNIPQYSALVKNYPTIKGTITTLLERETEFFTEEGNLGLVRIVVEYGSRWALKNLMKTYSSLSVSQVVKYIHLKDEQQAHGIITQMISEGDLPARLDVNGVLTFEEGMLDEGMFSPNAIQALLEKAQREGAELEALGRTMGADKQLLMKALKERETPYASGGGHLPDDEFESTWRGTDAQIAESLFD